MAKITMLIFGNPVVEALHGSRKDVLLDWVPGTWQIINVWWTREWIAKRSHQSAYQQRWILVIHLNYSGHQDKPLTCQIYLFNGFNRFLLKSPVTNKNSLAIHLKFLISFQFCSLPSIPALSDMNSHTGYSTRLLNPTSADVEKFTLWECLHAPIHLTRDCSSYKGWYNC